MWREDLQGLSAAIHSHPRFPMAAQNLVRELVAWRTRLGVANRVISSLGREHIIEHLLYLHYARSAGRVGHGAAFQRLVALSEARDRFGARAVRTGLRLIEIAGFAVRTRSRYDARLKIFEPTAPLVAHVRDYFAVIFGVFDELLSGGGLRARMLEDPYFVVEILERLGRAFLDGRPAPGSRDDGFAHVLRLEGARPVLAVVILSHWGRQDIASPQQLALQFHVSSSQARVILKTAAAQGLIALAPRGRLVDASPLTEAYLRTYCRSLAIIARHGLEFESRLSRRD